MLYFHKRPIYKFASDNGIFHIVWIIQYDKDIELICSLFKDLFIMDYNRVVKDLNGLTTYEYMLKVSEKFRISTYEGVGPYKPFCRHTYGMYMDGKWYELAAKEGTYNPYDPVDRLDVSILQNNLLKPILGIENPRTDKRIDFIGGIGSLEKLEKV